MTAILYHGTYTQDMALHLGLCLTPDRFAAERYADQYRDCDGDAPTVHTVEVALDGLTVVETDETWDSQPETATEDADRFADSGSYPEGVDVLIYTDYALGTEQMTTYRLLTDKALAAAKIVDSEEI